MLKTSSALRPVSPNTSTNYNWWVTVSVMISAFIVIVDGMIFNIALPKIMSSFGVDVFTDSLCGHLIHAGVCSDDASCWLGQRFGNKRLFLLCLGLFIVTSGLCGRPEVLRR